MSKTRVFLFSTFVFSTFSSISAFSSSFENAVSDQDLANRHSPILISRRDQISNSNTDEPLLLGYSVLRTGGETQIIYTTYFGDEDSSRKESDAEARMSRYGRRLDVEWTYAVRVRSKTGEVLQRSYHCDQMLGIGHRTCRFKGKFEAGTDHPILYLVARHNIFRDRPTLPLGAKNGRRIELKPEVEITYPKSRDMIPLERPELFRASDVELAREGKLAHPSTEYLFLRLRGALHGRIIPFLEDSIGIRFKSAEKKKGSLRELGLDLWGKESVIAIWLPETTRRNVRLGAGDFKLGFIGHSPGSRIHLEEIGAYMLEEQSDSTYVTTDLSSRIHCKNLSDLSSCRI